MTNTGKPATDIIRIGNGSRRNTMVNTGRKMSQRIVYIFKKSYGRRIVLLMRNTNQPVKGIITISLRIYTVGFARNCMYMTMRSYFARKGIRIKITFKSPKEVRRTFLDYISITIIIKTAYRRLKDSSGRSTSTEVPVSNPQEEAEGVSVFT